MKYLYIVLAAAWLLVSGCNPAQNTTQPLEQLLRQSDVAQLPAWQNAAEYDIQLLYTRIDRDSLNVPTFTTYTWRVDTSTYFFPSQAVYPSIAALSLAKLNIIYTNPAYGKPNADTPLYIDADAPPFYPNYSSATSPDSLPTVGQYISNMLLQGQSAAYNRLYEFLGRNYINYTLSYKGIAHTNIIARHDAPAFDTYSNRFTNALRLQDRDSLHYEQPKMMGDDKTNQHLDKALRGKAYLRPDGEVINQPFDLGAHNYMALPDLERSLRILLFPEYTHPDSGYYLTEENYQDLNLLLDRKRTAQRGQGFAQQLPPSAFVMGQMGRGYGFSTDCAYIFDPEAGIEFLIGAVIYTNANAVFNDDQYEYSTIADPLLGAYAQAIYNHELGRARAHRPDFMWFARVMQ